MNPATWTRAQVGGQGQAGGSRMGSGVGGYGQGRAEPGAVGWWRGPDWLRGERTHVKWELGTGPAGHRGGGGLWEQDTWHGTPGHMQTQRATHLLWSWVLSKRELGRGRRCSRRGSGGGCGRLSMW